MLEMTQSHHSDLSFIGWALDLDQVKVHSPVMSKMCPTVEKLQFFFPPMLLLSVLSVAKKWDYIFVHF